MDDLQRLIAEVSQMKVRLGQMLRVGAISEVKSGGGEQKIRVKIGKGQDGKDVLSPWLHTGDHRGGAREEFRYKKDQNVLLISPNGDYRQAMAVPWAESQEKKRPDHASDDSESYQYETLRKTDRADSHETWLADDNAKSSDDSVALLRMGEPQQQGGQGQPGQGQGGQQQAKPKGKILLKAKEQITVQVGQSTVTITDGTIEAKVGDSTATVKDGHAHIKSGINSIFVDRSGCWSTKPIQLKGDED